MSKFGLWAIAAIAILTLLYLVYLAATFEAPTGTTTVVVPASAAQTEPEPSAVIVQPSLTPKRLQAPPEPPAAAAEPVIEEAPEEVEIVAAVVDEADSTVVQLPTLNDSDEFVFQSLRTLHNSAALLNILTDEQLIRSLVVFVDNISRGEFPQTGLPYRRMQQEMQVRNLDDNLYVMDQSAHARFDQLVDTLVAIDTDQAMVLYRTLSPLFQQAYAEIGFRNVNFDDTLRSAINIVLDLPNVEGPYQLVKPSVMYLYADANIENLEEVQKLLIRLGPDNTEQLKTKLREFSASL